MRALTVLQPWAWAIVSGLKDVENRSWTNPYRGRLAIHAGKRYDTEGADACFELAARIAGRSMRQDFYANPTGGRGVVVGFVTLTGIEGMSQSPWWNGRDFAWQLADPVGLGSPFTYRGEQGLWELPSRIINARLENQP